MDSYTYRMEVFSPPPLKKKPLKRTRFLYPEGMNRSLFAWVYFGSVFFWMLLISGSGALLIFVLLPLFGATISFQLELVFMVGFGAFSIIFGMFMGSRVVSGIIAQGIAEGDIAVAD
jgi:hypothetical protein